MKWFIDCNSTIHPIYGTSSDPDWFIVSEKDQTVYTIDDHNMITGEYTLWNSLTELAKSIEPQEK